MKTYKCLLCGKVFDVEDGASPEICPVCAHPQAYFEINAENY